MKRFRNILILCVCCACFVINGFHLVGAFSSKPTVFYDGKRKELSFVKVNQTDLFANFKEVMPGDTLTQTIYVQANQIQKVTDVYLTMEKVDEVKLPQEILFRLYAEETLIVEDSLNNYETMSDGILLHRFEGEDTIVIKAVLEVPIEIGNEVANLCKNLKWTFFVQEDGVIIPPQTGDYHMPYHSVILSACSLTIIVWIFIKKRKEVFLKNRESMDRI